MDSALAVHKAKGGLSLNGLTQLSDRAAKALASCGNDLSLNGIRDLSADSADALAELNGETLCLNGVTALSDSAAVSLARFRGSLELYGLRKLGRAEAMGLSSHEGDLWLGLETLEDAVASALCAHRGLLSISGISHISDNAADALADLNGKTLCLNGVTALSDAAAGNLARFRGSLELYGLCELRKTAAVALAKHAAPLHLGIEDLSDAIAKVLATHQGGIPIMVSLRTLTPAAAEALVAAGNNEWLRIGMGDLPIGTARALAQHIRGQLTVESRCVFKGDSATVLSRAESRLVVSAGAAKALAQHRGASLWLIGLAGLSEPAARALAEHRGTLTIGELSFLSEAAAKALVVHEGQLVYYALGANLMDPARRQNDLNIESLVERAKTQLEKPLTAKRTSEAVDKDHCVLSEYTDIEDAAAKILAKYEGSVVLDGLRKLDAGAARALAAHKGGLSLGGLEEFAEELFAIFDENHDAVAVPILTDIDKVAATKGDDAREFIVGLEFYYCDVNYNGYLIMRRDEIRILLAALETDCKIGTPNMPGDWHEEFDIALLKGCFSIHSPWPSDIKAMRKLFGRCVGEVSLFDSVWTQAPRT